MGHGQPSICALRASGAAKACMSHLMRQPCTGIRRRHPTGRRCAAMISEERKARMESQGWNVVGTHSAVKLCRWTKSMLQGKGGCYKHTFYGIASHRCMEHTPNVSCANKCTFCWRNHINPVALDWKFDQDSPEALLEES